MLTTHMTPTIYFVEFWDDHEGEWVELMDETMRPVSYNNHADALTRARHECHQAYYEDWRVLPLLNGVYSEENATLVCFDCLGNVSEYPFTSSDYYDTRLFRC